MDIPPIQLPELFNAASYFIDKHIAEGKGEAIAIECGNARISYRTLYENVNRLGNVLLEFGLDKGDRVILILPDIPEFAYSFFGAIKIGAVPVPVNTMLNAADYEYTLRSSRASALITTAALYLKIQATVVGFPSLKSIVVDESFMENMQNKSSALQPAATYKDDPAFWLYSSGSTGLPKACVHLQHDMVICSERYAKGILSMNEHDRCFSVSKLFFAYGLGNALYYPFAVGATSILMPGPPKPENIFDTIARYKPTLFFSVPTNYNALLTYAADHDDIKLSSIRAAVSAGELLPATLFKRFELRFGIEILDSIGSTEVAQAFITNRPGFARAGSAGQVIPGYEAKILDEHGEPVKTGEVGDLFIKSDSTCAYYWDDPEKTKEVIKGDWIKTGDKFYQDADAYFWFVGRSDDMIKSSGAWVSPVEVEAILMEHPAVLEAAVVGREDKDGLAKPVAYVVLRNDFSANGDLAEEIKKSAAQTLAPYKCPREIIFLTELPKTTTGKIQRFTLRAK